MPIDIEKMPFEPCKCGGMNYSYAVLQVTEGTARFEYRCERCGTAIHSEVKPYTPPPPHVHSDDCCIRFSHCSCCDYS